MFFYLYFTHSKKMVTVKQSFRVGLYFFRRPLLAVGAGNMMTQTKCHEITLSLQMNFFHSCRKTTLQA